MMVSTSKFGSVCLYLSAVVSYIMVCRAGMISDQRDSGVKFSGDSSKHSSRPDTRDANLSFGLVSSIKPVLGSVTDSGNVIVVGIAGGSGSGKTTLARAIYEEMGDENVVYISHDSYYRDISHLSIEERAECNFDHPDSLETSLLIKHIKLLKSKVGVHIPSYDYSTHSRVLNSGEDARSRPIIIVEGILILSDPELQSLMDIKIYVDTDDDIRLIRRIQRDTAERGRTVQSVVSQYLRTVQPMHIQYVVPSKRNANIIVPEGLNSVALDLVVSKLKIVLDQRECERQADIQGQCKYP